MIRGRLINGLKVRDYVREPGEMTSRAAGAWNMGNPVARHVENAHGGKMEDRCPACREMRERYPEEWARWELGASGRVQDQGTGKKDEVRSNEHEA